jgi:threonine dehydrogenase-like Zn-dependent dehydrogenase
MLGRHPERIALAKEFGATDVVRSAVRRRSSAARAYIEELLPDDLEGRIEPGRVFDRVTDLDGVSDGYRAMNEREAIKVLVEP